MADDATRLQVITNNIEATRVALTKAARNIAGLLQVGRATCDEVRAYNLWALAIYNSCRGMLERARAAGQTGLPALPAYPTLFAWKGQSGEQAWNISCAGQASSLSGAIGRALRGPDENTQFLSTNDVSIVTQDQFVYNPESSPTFNTLLQVQMARQQGAGLGVPVLLIVIAGISIMAIAAAVVAIMEYLKTSDIQEANTRQVQLQADAFANYTAARLACYADCTKGGKSTQECVEICKGLVDKPNIKLPGQTAGWGWLQWTGFTVVAGVGALAAYKIWQRKQAGKPIFELPSFEESAT